MYAAMKTHHFNNLTRTTRPRWNGQLFFQWSWKGENKQSFNWHSQVSTSLPRSFFLCQSSPLQFSHSKRVYLLPFSRLYNSTVYWFLPLYEYRSRHRIVRLGSYYVVTSLVITLPSSPVEQGAAVLLSSRITWPLNRVLRIQLSMITCTLITCT